MATFTMRLKDIAEQVYGESLDPDDYEIERDDFTFNGITYGDLPVLPDNGAAFGLAQYPIFDNEYRPILNGKIVDEYWNREIGVETIDNFKLVLRRKMQQIMPYYNKLYESELIEFDALSTMDINSVSEGAVEANETANGTNVASSENTSGSRVVNSDTPQTQLAGMGDYATSGTDANSKADVTSNAEQNSTSESNTATNSNNRVTGFQGAASDLIIKFRNAQINLDTLILADINDCFMLLLNDRERDYNYRNPYYGWNF